MDSNSQSLEDGARSSEKILELPDDLRREALLNLPSRRSKIWWETPAELKPLAATFARHIEAIFPEHHPLPSECIHVPIPDLCIHHMNFGTATLVKALFTSEPDNIP
jgi:hypothetical protein